ncbi:FxSxx-COOH system tetratricopeptide repeat protein [Asanoa iriomotensis]|uniref:FxSxx-COOH system tetratricopeptide repeat protein n=1 Tax=Asanoa iriomotensis TaxID=234613 RepID=UPI001941CE21|nr:FxSxx-COOH system tetratricopeptide repeat protein [Asanoa iriomotensis]
MTDLFVSHAGRDRSWAEWVAWELQEAGYDVELDLWDWEVGENFVEKMRDALEHAERMIALFSAAYFEPERHTSPELTAYLSDRGPARKRILPVRIENVTPPLLYRPLLSVDLFGVPEDEARRRMLAAVRGRQRPDGRPEFPGSGRPRPQQASGPRLPGSLPPVWNVPPRNTAFTGRDRMIVDLREGLLTGSPVVAQALEGMGGVGKTQLAIEYAYRFANEYELVWWIASEQPDLIAEQFAALAVAARVAPAEGDVTAAVTAALALLRSHDRALLIFDNAESREDVRRWLPGGPAHVLVTSRNSLWTGVARPIGVDVFARSESIALLRANLPRSSDEDVDRLAEAVGDLPLAVAQAADLLAETGMSVESYLSGLAEHAADLLANDPPPAGYPVPLAAAVTVAARRLAAADPAAGQLLILCAYLAPEPIPLDLFRDPPAGLLPDELAAAGGGGVALDRAAARLTRYGLARNASGGLQLHRLTQAVLRDTDPNAEAQRTTVESLLVAGRLDDGTDPTHWPRWTQLLPHILACDPANSDNSSLHWLAFSAIWHLLARGDARTAFPLAEHLHATWTRRYGADNSSTLSAATALAYAHGELGDHGQARRLDEDTAARYKRIFGEDHLNTLISTNNLAADYRQEGRYEQARRLNEETLSRIGGIVGDDHPETLRTANDLATNLASLGEFQQARDLHEDTLARRRQILGVDHPQSLVSANNLAVALYGMGEYELARQLDEDTLTRRRRVLGDDHPYTLSSASNLASDLRALGDHAQARRFEEDTLVRRRRILGDAHPDTLSAAAKVVGDLRQLGEDEPAQRLEDEMSGWRS